MRYFREQGKSDHEVIASLDAKFGDNYQIMTRKTVKLGGILGVGRRTGVEYFGYIKEKSAVGAGSQLGRHSKARAINKQGDIQRLSSSSTDGSLDRSGASIYKKRIGGYDDKVGKVTEDHDDLKADRGRRAKQYTGRSSSHSVDEEKQYFAVSEEEQAECDQRNREDILARFAKNKEVQKLLREKKLIIENSSANENSDSERNAGLLPKAPHLGTPAHSGLGREHNSVHGAYEAHAMANEPLEQRARAEDPNGEESLSSQVAPTAWDPEYASVNYDILAVARREGKQWQGMEQAPYIQPHPYLENIPAAGPNDFGTPQHSRAANDYNRASSLPASRNFEGPKLSENRAGSLGVQWHQAQGQNTPRGGAGLGGNGAYTTSAVGSHPIYPKEMPSTGWQQGYGNYRKPQYSNEVGSPYQRSLDQMETTFLQRLDNLERKLDRRGSMTEPGSLTQLRENLYHNEFPPLFVDRLTSQMKRELPLDELEKLPVLWEYVLQHIAENLRFIDMQQQSQSRIMVLVGPTGVGKTTTIAKLAARQCVEAMGGSKKVHLITLDNYRIGAQDQIRTYGEILGAKVDCVETTEGLAICIEQDKESDMILIDTMGRSPSDHMKLAEMRHFLEYSGNCEIHLAMSATSGASAMKEVITQFKPFGFRSVILTKLDELGRIGGILATFLQEDLPLSYVTTGQKVPQDICPASALVLFQQLYDVQVDWQNFAQKLEENIF